MKKTGVPWLVKAVIRAKTGHRAITAQKEGLVNKTCACRELRRMRIEKVLLGS